MEEQITSRKNPLLQQVRRLLASRQERQAAGLFAGDGTKLLEEAVKWKAGLHAVILADGIVCPALPGGVPVYRVPPDVMQFISPMKTPQGALFLCRLPERQPLVISPGTVILDGLQDPGNLGTILRTADAFSIPVVLANGCADPFGWKAVRASMGAVFRTPPIQADNEEILSYCRCNGLPLAVTALSAKAKDIRQAPVHRWAVVIGSEGHGVCPQFMENCKQSLIIPMSSRCESLNAASAAAIVLWQMRQGMEI